VLSSIGGAIGIALSYGIGFLASMHPSMVEVKVPLWPVLLALGISAAVGVFFGIIPRPRFCIQSTRSVRNRVATELFQPLSIMPDNLGSD